jgi:phage FluMu protein Com
MCYPCDIFTKSTFERMTTSCIKKCAHCNLILLWINIMFNINFTCPHCSFSKQLPASSEGMQGNCPSCKAVVTITAVALANPSVLPQQPLPQQPLPLQTGFSVSKSSQSENWTYEPIVSNLDDSVLHTFRTTSISGTDKHGQPIDLFVRFGNGVMDILIDWKGTCFADAHSTF